MQPHRARSSSSAPGPAGRDWLTPQVAAVLAAADDLVGYGPYLARVPPNPRQNRHASDNRVEADRAAHALDLAAAGRVVAVVSGGDPGVFAMAAAVLEVAAQEKYVDVPVRVLPGVTASSAVAAAVGAPLGHDHAVISLSDRLKPWEVVAERLVGRGRAPTWRSPSTTRARGPSLAAGRRPRPAAGAPRPGHAGGAGPRRRRRGRAGTVTTLAELDPEQVDMRTLVIVGSSTTRVVRRGGRDVVFTPRHYRH